MTYARGEKHYRAKIKDADVQDILDLKAENDRIRAELRVLAAARYTTKDVEVSSRKARLYDLRYKAIGERYGVTTNAIYQIIAGNTFKHVGEIE